MLSLRVRVELGVTAKKRYSTFPKAPGLEHYHQMQFSVISRTLVSKGSPFCRGIVGVFYSPSRCIKRYTYSSVHFFVLHEFCRLGNAPGVEVTSSEINPTTRVQIEDKSVCISLRAKTPTKGINTILYLPTMGK